MSYTCADENGKIDYPLGPNTRGYIMYTADGYMSVSMSAGDRPNRASDDLMGGTDEEKITEAEEVVERWEAIKKAERAGKGEDTSALAGAPKALPALQRAQRTCEKAVAAGFAWEDARGALAKLKEEVGELEAELEGVTGPDDLDGEREERAIAELGDVLLAGAHLGRYLGADPEGACRAAVRRFEERFRRMEGSLGEGGVSGRPLAELLAAWEEAKVAR